VAKVDALAQLKDIHLPESISWWPLAPGWYVVMLLMVFLIVGLAFWVHQRHLNALAKNQALELLKVYQDQYEKDRNAQLLSARISELLKRVALVYYSRADVASLHGESWVEFLTKTSKDIDFKPVKSMLLDSPFKTNETVSLNPLINRARLWIKQRGVPCSN
jgi:hypothetical protein